MSQGIRPGTQADYGAVTAVWRASVLATHSFLHAEHFALLEKQLPHAYLPSLNELWIYHWGEAVAAFCGCNGNNVEMLFVQPDYAHRGIGCKLLDHAYQLHGPLQVDVNEQNRKALAFYLRRGFRITGRSDLDRQGWPYPILHMRQEQNLLNSAFSIYCAKNFSIGHQA